MEIKINKYIKKSYRNNMIKLSRYSLIYFSRRWADLPCDVMEERERAGEKVGEMGPACLQVHSRQKTCTIQPLRMNCYKLWLEVPSRLGPIRSKPIYLSPIDHGEQDGFMCGTYFSHSQSIDSGQIKKIYIYILHQKRTAYSHHL